MKQRFLILLNVLFFCAGISAQTEDSVVFKAGVNMGNIRYPSGINTLDYDSISLNGIKIAGNNMALGYNWGDESYYEFVPNATQDVKFTISSEAPSVTITRIVFQSYIDSKNKGSVGNLELYDSSMGKIEKDKDNKVGTWKGESNGVTFYLRDKGSTRNMRLSSIIVCYNDARIITIGNTGYSTLYYGKSNLIVPDGVTALTYNIRGESLEVSHTYNVGEIIPSGTAVVLKAKQGAYSFRTTTNEGFVDKTNMLKGSDTDALTEGENCKFYKLTTKDYDPASVGFYYAEEDGAAFISKAHKAYLAIPNGIKSKASYRFEDETTEIGQIKTANFPREKSSNFTLSGMRVEGKPTQGVYIINGRKVLVK